MPKAARRPFEILSGHFLGLCFQWKVFKQLYASGQKRIDLMNETAPGFLGHLQPIWLDGVILGVTRLLDPAETTLKGRKVPNLTLRQLIHRLDGEDQDFLDRLGHHLNRLGRLGKPFRDHRNKRIAHADYWHGTRVRRLRLPGLPQQRIEEMLRSLEQFMDAIRDRYGMGAMMYTDVEAAAGADGNALLWSLVKAAAWDAEHPDPLENAMRISKSRYADAWGDG